MGHGPEMVKAVDGFEKGNVLVPDLFPEPAFEANK